ncbi:TPM domain-containing protein [Faecalibacter rhinopitheci]|uniref:TPM domain-containing protein n=1 Tax=Faecalibacter rhinopitheci TaxID=2779678 RepID=A0A8J7FNT6_9FLAO|nr:TPM domain-containing protein [Faecalibacter rhinopitheci]MBF0596519.1 TPM domain-containing protein [Faecalibacter rhinopitheci]MBQ0147291.1 TPM domain-containing protein [Candidatus Onthonaster equi]
MGKKENIFLTTKQEQNIIQAIQRAENNTSGEIRVHIEFESSTDHYAKALEVFERLEMYRTKDRNAVLFHVCPTDHNFTIIGDEGIHALTPENFWDEIKNEVISYFKEEKYSKGLCRGIEMTGDALKQYFPFQKDDQNELSDEISYS